MFHSTPLLPQVPIYGFIGGVPETFGGRTSACLQRANAFAELDKRNIEILTLSPAHAVDPEGLTARLRSEGRIGNRVAIRNIWADLRRADDSQLQTITGQHRIKTSASRGEGLLPYEGNPESVRLSDSGKKLQTDRFRDDGSRFLSYRIDAHTSDNPGGKTVTLYSHNETAIGRWSEQHDLYFAWIDWVIGDTRAVLINDGPPLAKYMHKYRRDTVVFVQTIHSRHSSAPDSPHGALSPTYLPTLKHMEQFDRVAVLTQAQHDDLTRLHFGADNLVTLPNMFVADPPKKRADRPAGSGVMLARLSHQKRIHHAIQAVFHARADGLTQATLDVYGMDDDASEHLKTLIVDQGLDGIVTLRGYVPHAKQQFEHASFTLLTSEYEGQPLVLLEAMAAGCIPIAYDIAYGPADIITDGVDGFLVKAGDIEALGARIQQLTQMTDREIRKMRKAAMKRAQDFRPSVITSRWGKTLQDALDSKVPVAVPRGRAELSSISTDARDIHLSVLISGKEVEHPDWAMLVWEQRRGIGFGRTPATARQVKGGSLVEGSIPLDILSRQMDKNVDFWIDLRVQGNPLRLRIKGVKREEAVSSAQGIRFYGTKYGSLSADLVTDDES